MFRGFRAEWRRLLFWALGAAVLGWLLGRVEQVLLVGAVLYIVWLLWQMRRLNVWLMRDHDGQAPPEAAGLWGEVFDNIYRLQRQQQHEKRNLQAVISRVQETTAALRDGIVLLDWRGHLDWWNPAAQKLLGLRMEDRGQPVANFIRHPRFISHFESGDYREPISLPSPRFASKRLQFQVTPFGQNERLIVVRDITQLYKLEQMRKDFVANVSHELRTPLTVITGYLETLEAGAELSEAQRRALRAMGQQSQRMSLLVSDLLTLSRLETTDADHKQQTFDPGVLMDKLETEARTLAGEKNQQLVLSCEPGLQLTGNEKELHSAFSNLAVNALKYTPEGGRIELRLYRQGDNVCFSVSDNGPGIEAKHLPHLTERFYRVESSRNSTTGGTGLGLAIVKHILLRHEAKLTIDSMPGQGSRFVCVFPACDGLPTAS